MGDIWRGDHAPEHWQSVWGKEIERAGRDGRKQGDEVEGDQHIAHLQGFCRVTVSCCKDILHTQLEAWSGTKHAPQQT